MLFRSYNAATIAAPASADLSPWQPFLCLHLSPTLPLNVYFFLLQSTIILFFVSSQSLSFSIFGPLLPGWGQWPQGFLFTVLPFSPIKLLSDVHWTLEILQTPSPEGLYVWTQMSDWDPPDFLQTFPGQLLRPQNVWRSQCEITARDPLQENKHLRRKNGVIHVEDTDEDVKRAFGDKRLSSSKQQTSTSFLPRSLKWLKLCLLVSDFANKVQRSKEINIRGDNNERPDSICKSVYMQLICQITVSAFVSFYGVHFSILEYSICSFGHLWVAKHAFNTTTCILTLQSQYPNMLANSCLFTHQTLSHISIRLELSLSLIPIHKSPTLTFLFSSILLSTNPWGRFLAS